MTKAWVDQSELLTVGVQIDILYVTNTYKRVFNLHQNCKILDILYLNTLKIINWELL